MCYERLQQTQAREAVDWQSGQQVVVELQILEWRQIANLQRDSGQRKVQRPEIRDVSVTCQQGVDLPWQRIVVEKRVPVDDHGGPVEGRVVYDQRNVAGIARIHVQSVGHPSISASPMTPSNLCATQHASSRRNAGCLDGDIMYCRKTGGMLFTSGEALVVFLSASYKFLATGLSTVPMTH